MTDQVKSSSEPQPAEEGESVSAANESRYPTARIRVVVVLVVIAVIVGGAVAMVANRTSTPADRGVDEKVTSVGSVEVTGRLIELRGDFLPDDGLYNYAFLMKYEILEVHRGKVDAKQIIVAHYNPVKPRTKVADEFYPDIGGTLSKFRAEDVHRMALEVPIDDHYIGGIIDRYSEEEKGPIYWAIWTNLANSH